MAAVNVGDLLADKYRVEAVLGEGGMGVVVAAMHLALDERVAIKLMRPEALLREDGVARFLREARAVVKLKSEHVARVLDVGTLETGEPYIVMEYLEGQDLAHRLLGQGPVPVTEVVDIVLQACDAIAEAHGRGIVHRDLKPANLFLTTGRAGEPLVKVLDFGISKVNSFGDKAESVTHSAVLLGSPVYMSPEQMRSSRDVDVTTDIWSLGVILYEAFGGRVPFDEQTIGALMARVLTEAPPSLALARPDLPLALVAVVSRCLEKDASKRYPSVAELAEALAAFGPKGAALRVERIHSMVPPRPSAGSLPGAPALPLVITGQENATTMGLGVAATQAAPDTVRSAARPPARFNPIVGLLIGVVALAIGVGVSLFGGKPSSTTSSSSPHRAHASLAPPDDKTLRPALVDAASPPDVNAPVASAASRASSTLASAPARSTRPAPSAASSASPSADPFGKSRL